MFTKKSVFDPVRAFLLNLQATLAQCSFSTNLETFRKAEGFHMIQRGLKQKSAFAEHFLFFIRFHKIPYDQQKIFLKKFSLLFRCQ